MTIKRKGATSILFLQILFILPAFGLLSLRDGKFDIMTLVAGGVLVFYNLFQYNMMKVSFKHIDRFVLLAAQFLWSLGLVVLYRLDPELALKQFVCLLI